MIQVIIYYKEEKIIKFCYYLKILTKNGSYSIFNKHKEGCLLLDKDSIHLYKNINDLFAEDSIVDLSGILYIQNDKVIFIK